ncbi:MAG: hypothetical protein M0Z55_00840 [Peptococcaceae bacterium]|nr:hypothetical protein [Peptococcaceae bacterium]
MPDQLTEAALANAREFVREGIAHITGQQAGCPSRFLVSSAPVPTALAMLALTASGPVYTANIAQGQSYLLSTQHEDGWGNTPAEPNCELATAICHKGLAAAESPSTVNGLIYDAAYLIARTWTQDFDRLAPGWLPKQGSALIKFLEAFTGKQLVPSLENLGLKDLASISHFMPPYGRPTILAVTLIKEFYRQGLSREVARASGELLEWISPNGSWCEDIVVTSLAIMALHLTGNATAAVNAAAWLCASQYDNGGWPSFNQLTNWSVAWAAVILGPQDHNLRQAATAFLQAAANQDGSFGTAAPHSYPDLDDTAISLLGLAQNPKLNSTTLDKTSRLLLKLQNWDGSWGTFPSFTGTPPECTCDFPVYIKSEDVTVHVIQALLQIGLPKANPAITKAVTWLVKRQQPDGTWNSTWFLGKTYATAQVLDTLVELIPDSAPVQKGVAFLRAKQCDGHWDMRSAGEAGLALYTLLKAGEPPHSATIQSGLRYLRSIQKTDGSFYPSYSGFYASRLYYEEPLSEAMAALRAMAKYLDMLDASGPN